MHATFALQRPPLEWVNTVYGVMLNHRLVLDDYGQAAYQAPHKAPPQAPVMYIKPRNTWAGDGEVVVPADVAGLELDACLGLVIGQTTRRVPVAQALSRVAGYLAVADVRVPHSVYYRPSVRYLARDGFCRLASLAVAAKPELDPDAMRLQVWVDGVLVQDSTTGERLRTAAQLLADVSEFMTLNPGDVLLTGASHGAPVVKAGQSTCIVIGPLPPLQHQFVSEVRA